MSEFKYDVFISYSHKDIEWVQRELIPRLKKAKLKICVDDQDFPIGGVAIVTMQDSIEVSRRTLLVLTPRYMTSEWTEFEMLASRTLDPAAHRRRTIPLMVEKVEKLPLLLSMLSYADLTRPENQEKAWKNLIRSLKLD
jgi:TIR domain